jgi:hypothetical protein
MAAIDASEHVPMPAAHSLVGTVRDDRYPVARVTFVDGMGETRTLDLQPHVALALAGDLIDFIRQVGL